MTDVHVVNLRSSSSLLYILRDRRPALRSPRRRTLRPRVTRLTKIQGGKRRNAKSRKGGSREVETKKERIEGSEDRAEEEGPGSNEERRGEIRSALGGPAIERSRGNGRRCRRRAERRSREENGTEEKRRAEKRRRTTREETRREEKRREEKRSRRRKEGGREGSTERGGREKEGVR